MILFPSLALQRPLSWRVLWGWPLLLGLVLATDVRAQSVNLSVDTTHPVRTVDDRAFGLNTACWDWFFNNWPAAGTATTNLLQAIDVRALRFPGGGASDTYHWTTNTKVNWPATTTSQMGTDFAQFAQVAASLKAGVFITANYGTGTPQEAAAWVAYANANAAIKGTGADVNLGTDSNGTNWQTAGYWSALRAAAPLATDDGLNSLRINQPAPFGFRYWEIGNECYNNAGEADTNVVQWDAYTYATRAASYLAAMKAVDPTIKAGVVVLTGEDTGINGNTSHPATNPRTGVAHNGWTPVLLATLKALGVTPDFLIYHYYVYGPGQENDTTLLQASGNWPNDAADLRQQLIDYLGSGPAANVELVVTENNSVWSNPGKQSTSLVNGLYLADSTGSLLQTEFNSLIWWDARDGQQTGNNNSSTLYGWRNYGDYGILTGSIAPAPNQPYPTYYVMKLLSHFARGGDTVVRATTSNSQLAVYAVQRADGSLSLLVINKDAASTFAANVNLGTFGPLPGSTVYSYGIPQDSAAQTGNGPTDLATSSISNAAPLFSISVAPYSATVISLQPGPASPVIAVQPVNQTATPGQDVVYSVTASSNPAPIYKWQRRASGSSTWTNLSDNGTYAGSATATLTVNSVTAAVNGDSFQCVTANSNGAITTSPVALVVNTPFAVVSLISFRIWFAGSTMPPASNYSFNLPADIALDSTGNAYLANTGNDTVQMLTAGSDVFTLSTLAGQVGISGSADGSSTACFNHPAGVAADSSGNVYVADTDNNEIRKVTTTGVVSTLAGQAGITGSADGTGTGASFNGPSGIVADATGNLYVADTLNHTIRKVTSTGAVTTIAGLAGSSGFVDAIGIAARFHGPQGLALDASGNLFVADTNNNAIRKIVTASGTVATVAGQSGIAGSTDGTNSQAQFHFPSGVAVDPQGNVYIADTDNHTLREIAPSGTVSTLAGLAGTSGNADGIGTAARFDFPTGVAVDSSGDVYVADTNNNSIRLAVIPAAPQITVQLWSTTAPAGSDVSFSVTATGKPAPAYQWSFNGTAINGATGSTLNLTNVQPANTGTYTVVVTNLAGTVTGNPATLTVNSVSTPPSGGSGGSGSGGGGAPSEWFYGALSLLALASRLRPRR